MRHFKLATNDAHAHHFKVAKGLKLSKYDFAGRHRLRRPINTGIIHAPRGFENHFPIFLR
jgi:hypothetical protein